MLCYQNLHVSINLVSINLVSINLLQLVTLLRPFAETYAQYIINTVRMDHEDQTNLIIK